MRNRSLYEQIPLIKGGHKTLQEITRKISPKISQELWARAAGRCQFSGCNRILYKSPVTQERVNLAQKAHIYSFSHRGPRGRGPFKHNPRLLNGVSNLILICHDCHTKIDQHKDGGIYSAELLKQWKFHHEKRIAIVTGVNPSKKSTVVLYGANIGDEKSCLQPHLAQWALFPQWYPAEETPIPLHMSWEGKDNQPDYWITEEQNLEKRFDRFILPLVEQGSHFSIFGLAPIPLLIRLGTLFTDKIPSEVYQLHREPKANWEWKKRTNSIEYRIKIPKTFRHSPALVISLSASISPRRITSVLGQKVSIWELTIDDPHNDFLKTRAQLSNFRKMVRQLMIQIAEKHGNDIPLSIFPAMPVATAVELGRVRMPKAEMPWVLYDQNNTLGAFVKALEIGGISNG